MTTTNDSPWLTADEAAAYLKIQTNTVHRLAASGQLKRHGTRRMYRFHREDLDEYLKGQGRD